APPSPSYPLFSCSFAAPSSARISFPYFWIIRARHSAHFSIFILASFSVRRPVSTTSTFFKGRHLLLLLKGVFLPDFLISEKRKGLPPSAYTSADNNRPYSNLSYSLVSKLSEKILNPAGVIQRDPPCAGFQLAPAGRSLTVRFLHNGKDTFPGILPGLPVIRPRSFPDI